jgi:hypothetical protein
MCPSFRMIRSFFESQTQLESQVESHRKSYEESKSESHEDTKEEEGGKKEKRTSKEEEEEMHLKEDKCQEEYYVKKDENPDEAKIDPRGWNKNSISTCGQLSIFQNTDDPLNCHQRMNTPEEDQVKPLIKQTSATYFMIQENQFNSPAHKGICLLQGPPMAHRSFQDTMLQT